MVIIILHNIVFYVIENYIDDRHLDKSEINQRLIIIQILKI